MKYNKSTESLAPALDRGITLFNCLNLEPGQNLEELSKRYSWPKASVSRLLDTFVNRKWIRKDDSKRFYPNFSLTDYKRSSEWNKTLEACLENLSEKTNLTVEWYEIENDYAIITKRHEAINPQVQLRAQLGFKRFFSGEIDAVAAVAINACNYQEVKSPWVYQQGEERLISKDELNNILINAKYCYGDKEYNPNGVRRIASAVMSKKKCKGILVLAENYTPKTDKYRNERTQALKNTSKTLETFLEENDETT